MKKGFTVLVAVALLLGMVGVAGALPFCKPVDFDDCTFDGRTVAILLDLFGVPFDNVPYTYSFDLDFDPPAIEINYAELSLTHWGNWSTKWRPEAWIATSEGGIKIGDLSTSGWKAGWVTDTWPLSGDVIAEIESHTPWCLTVVVDETTCGIDQLFLDKSTLCGDYAPVPEPGTIFLLGSGIVGLFGIGRKRLFKR